jgi:hypothetical protein
MLFPMADELLSPEQQEQLDLGMQRIEREEMAEGAPVKFHALAARLEGEVGRLQQG